MRQAIRTVWFAAAASGAIAVAADVAWGGDPLESPAGAQLEAIGGLALVNAQQSHLLLRTATDAFEKGTYDARQVRTITKGVVRQLDTISGLLRRVQDAGLGAEDDDYVDRVVETYRLLQDEARALNRYLDRQGESEADALDKARLASAKSVQALLGRSEAAEETPRANGFPGGESD